MERTAPGRLITGANVLGYLLLDRPRTATRIPADYRRPTLPLWRVRDPSFPSIMFVFDPLSECTGTRFQTVTLGSTRQSDFKKDCGGCQSWEF